MKNRTIDAQLRKVGNSFVITIPSNIIKKFKLKPKRLVTVTIENG